MTDAALSKDFVAGVLDAIDIDQAFDVLASCARFYAHNICRVYIIEDRAWRDVVSQRCDLGCTECAHLPISQTESVKSVTESVIDENDDFSV